MLRSLVGSEMCIRDSPSSPSPSLSLSPSPSPSPHHPAERPHRRRSIDCPRSSQQLAKPTPLPPRRSRSRRRSLDDIRLDTELALAAYPVGPELMDLPLEHPGVTTCVDPEGVNLPQTEYARLMAEEGMEIIRALGLDHEWSNLKKRREVTWREV
eukprot:TRINITY_DN21044_c0_g1_i2.p2 TRINITY_DN21044_c0_g1~~TRINITY_DN21044_c0_g1_i2.p2  ORF type:complete len:155 (-),score=32.50 TRINITY_DN21044_c0_g1_i2:547-1011(-)